MVYKSLILLPFIASAALANPLHSVLQRQEAGDNVTFAVTAVRYSGEGCPTGSINGTLDPSGNFDVFYAALNTTIEPGEFKEKIKCQIQVDIQTAAERQLVVLSGTFTGYVLLTEGAWAKYENQYKYAGNPGTIKMEWPFKAPINAVTKFTNTLSTEFRSGCNSTGGKFTLIINNYLSMSNDGKGEGQISVTELDGAVKQSTKLTTLPCP
ncbi:hypothetical protein CORC01_00084 [Colletotrichum orchidophilum]|uniref:Secreted protein n=1 Tax=Colletotrichum orchidophilum TaxID=1209926 RepID=A0A1G4BT98_9PEZI|nr:uncharacterized protein CORC01_00084 [Colletotrichum orchidophilum]OHF04613.1 hypothetical protein CORC01_00084 [Colletotrichum orchidophilum]